MNESVTAKLWREVEGEMRPLATRCIVCSRMTFPQAQRCRYCGSLDVADAVLDPRGVVEASSLMGGLLLVHVRTADGVLLLGQAEPVHRVRIASKVRFRPTEHMRFELDE